MPGELEKVCLGCTLLNCDDTSAECKFVQIYSSIPKQRKQDEPSKAALRTRRYRERHPDRALDQYRRANKKRDPELNRERCRDYRRLHKADDARRSREYRARKKAQRVEI